jgi:16S rRNA (cytidine1402-2'-O)-methyltransferase
LKNLADYLNSDRKVSICKEMTKIHENVIRGKASEIFKFVEENQINLKGEIVIVIEGTSKKITAPKINSKIKKEFLTKLSASESAKLISAVTGENKRDVYKKLIQT